MRRLVRLGMLIALVFSLLTVVSAQEEKTCPCCGKKLSEITWSTLTATRKTLPTGHFRLTKDTPREATLTASGTAVLDLNGYTLTAAPGERVMYVYSGNTYVFDSVGTGAVVGNGTTSEAGGLVTVRDGATMNIYGGTFTGGTTPEGKGGGNFRVAGTVNIYGGTVSGGTAAYHGGNFNVSSGIVNVYGGRIEGGRTTGDGRGGNFYLTGNTSQLNIYGGTITGGISAGTGGNIFAYKGSAVTIYDGTVENGVGENGDGNDIYLIGGVDGKLSSLDVYGGTVGSGENSILQHAETNPVRIYNGNIGQNPAAFLAECACYNKSGDRYTVWNYGHGEASCPETCPMEVAAEYVKTFYTGSHYYVATRERNTYACSLCNSDYCDAAAVAVAEGAVFTDLTKTTGNAVLLDDVTVEELVLHGRTLDLNGHTLTAQALIAATGNVIDSTQGQGLLIAPSLSLAENNTYLPLQEAEGLRFAALTPDTTLERLDDDTVRIRFVFEEKATQTQIDDLVLAGNTDVSVQLYLTWTKDGVKKARTYVCDPALLVKYAQKWDGRRFVATITGVENVTDLTCTVRLSANGVTYSDTTLKNYNPINNILSWEKINSFPYKTKDMTVDQMRQLCVDFFEYSKTFLWTPDESLEYLRNKNDSNDSMHQGTIYGGMPYVGNASGSPYRMMDYINPETGLVDMKKAIPALAQGGVLDMEALIFFGSQCAKTAGLGWSRVINSANYRATMYMTPANGVILLGDIAMDQSKVYWSENYRTTTVCQENGQQTMFEAYAQLQKADGMVQYTTAGHVIMAYSDAVVVRNPDGTINGDESYVMIIHQAQKWGDRENEFGDQYQMKSSVNTKSTFASLYSGGYVPFTFAEFVSGDPIEETTITVTEGENILISGTVRESDRVFVAETAPESLTFTQLCSATLEANYHISDAYIIIYNARGQEIYKHAVRATSCLKNMDMAATGDRVFTWEYGKPEQGEVYHAELVVQMLTGERPIIWSGDLLMDK